MKSRNFYLGLLILFIGVVALLSTLGVFTFHWSIFWRLWPIAFIFVGAALLPLNKYVKAIVMVLILAAGCVFYHLESKNYTGSAISRVWHNMTVWSDDDDQDEDDAEDFIDPEQHFAAPYRELEKATFDVEAGACDIELGKPCAELAKADVRSNFVKYTFKTELGDDNAALFLSGKGHTKNIKGRNENDIRIALNQHTLWDFKLDMGAADAELDFSPYRVNSIEINGGACDIELKLGDSGCNTQVDINTGVSDIDINVPAGVDCELVVESAITDKDFIGFEKVEKGLWRTPNFGEKNNCITIHLSCAVSDITVKRY